MALCTLDHHNRSKDVIQLCSEYICFGRKTSLATQLSAIKPTPSLDLGAVCVYLLKIVSKCAISVLPFFPDSDNFQLDWINPKKDLEDANW